MTERPILFSGPLVRAILAGTKHQTRRPLKPQPLPPDGRGLVWWHYRKHQASASNDPVGGPGHDWVNYCRYGKPGDHLWVRETWAPHSLRRGRERYLYRATHREGTGYPATWHPSIHMPRIASRLTLEVTGIRVERLHAITEEDARTEGLSDRAEFVAAWRGIYGNVSWEENPWVWVVDFKRLAPRLGIRREGGPPEGEFIDGKEK